MSARHSQAARSGRAGGNDTVGDRVLSLRNARGWNQEELATRVQISKSFLSEIENDRGLPGGQILMRLAEVLGATTDYILLGAVNTTETAPNEPISIPSELSALAEELHLSYSATRALLDARRFVVARRGKADRRAWNRDDWKKLHERLKDYLE
jgi:transcriptional regulator with XRE-family HTH domain